MARGFQTNKRKKRGDTAPMDAALKFLGYRARTVREVERHLDECQYGEVEIMDVINRLTELNLVDDRAYCDEFIASRLRAKPISRRHLYEQLSAHEADRETIREALEAAIDEERELENAVEVAKKYIRQFEGLSENERAARVQNRLINRGFGYETAQTALRLLTEEEDA